MKKYVVYTRSWLQAPQTASDTELFLSGGELFLV